MQGACKKPKWQHAQTFEEPAWRNSNPDAVCQGLEHPSEIRKAIYNTNAVESLNSVIRAATKQGKVFPTDDSARKVVQLAIKQASRKWAMPIRNWKMALNRFVLEFGERVTVHHP